MEVTAIRDRFIDNISRLEDVQDDMGTALSEVISPVYYNNNNNILPTFGKRTPMASALSAASTSSTTDTPTTSSTRNFRLNQLRVIMDRWKNALNQFRESMENSDSLQSPHYGEMLSLIDYFNNNNSTGGAASAGGSAGAGAGTRTF